MMVLGLLPACSGDTPQATGTGTVAPTAAGQVFNWRWQSTALAGTPTYWVSQEFADNVKAASGGRLNLDLQPQGAIVGMMEIFDAVATGAIETGNAVDAYWQGKDQRFNLTGIIAADFTWQQAASYYYADSTGGDADADALFAKFGIQRIVFGISECEVEAMSNRKLEKPSDFKGLTFRGAGYSPLILQEPEFGASGVILATADVYTSLQTKVIDACEVGNAFSNYGSGYQEVTKYWSFPGIHQLCQLGSFMVNMDMWKQLPSDLRMILRTCSSQYTLRSWAFSHVESAKIIPVLQDKYGIVIYRESPELQTLWKTVGWRIADNFAAKLPEFKTMWDKHKAFMTMLQPYEVLQTVTYTNTTAP